MKQAVSVQRSAIRSLAVAALLLCALLVRQRAFAGPVFEVASVRPAHHPRTADGWSYSYVKVASPGRLVAFNSSLGECLEWAYDLKEFQILGPDWLHSGPNYDIEAKTSPETSTDQIRLMLQALLAERFQLKVHRETRIQSIYALVVSKNGPRLQKAVAGGDGGLTSEGGANQVRVTSEKANMDALAHRLSRDLDRPVLNRTGLKDSFRITLSWARQGYGPSIFTALQEQLGLKLRAAKAPIEVLVVDSADKAPSEN